MGSFFTNSPYPTGPGLGVQRDVELWKAAVLFGRLISGDFTPPAGGGFPISNTSSSPAKNAEAITNDVAFSNPSKGIYVGVTGDVSAVMSGGQTVVYKAVPVGVILPIVATKVTSANTTATNLLNLWG